MKIIDLLNKIANGEKVPKVIYFWEREYIYDEEYNCYMHQTGANEFINLLDNDTDDSYYFLNDEVEIIGENIPVKIDQNDREWHYLHNTKKTTEEIADNLEHLRQKINEIIDYLEEKE